MKKIYVWLNEKEYKDFVERARKYHKSPYSLLKKLVLIELERPLRN